MSKVGKYEVYYENLQEFRSLRREIFDRNNYYFETENKQPVIVDVGAHIGLSSLYFKKLYPEARILCVEPNPVNIRLLRQNIEVNRLENVAVVEAAVDVVTGERELYVDGTGNKWFSTGSFTKKAWDGSQENKAIKVATKTLDELVDWPVDLLKMDVEGAEQEVLMSSSKALGQVRQLMVEYHPIHGNSIVELAEFLEEQGFEVGVYKHGDRVSVERARGLVMVEARQNFLTR